MSYIRVFMNAYCGIFKQKLFWVSNIKDCEKILTELCYTNTSANLCYFINSPSEFNTVTKLTLAFSSSEVRYITNEGIPLSFDNTATSP